MATITFDVAAFRAQFPQFANVTDFPDVMLEGYFDTATCYISPSNNYGYLRGTCRERALYLMTAHLSALYIAINSGNPTVFVSQSTVDKVSVTITPPPMKDQFQYWLNLTPYGAQILALLNAKAVGGWFVGGLPELAAFRRVGGLFRP